MSFIQRKRECYFTTNKITDIDYKNVELLERFINDSGKILPTRITATKARYQRKLTTAIKRARYLALIKYCDAHKSMADESN